MKTPILQTQRLILRPISLGDAPAVQKYFNNWNIVKHLNRNIPWPYPDDGAETFIKDILSKEKEDHTWAIVRKDGDDEAIGLIGFEDGETQYGNRGFWLAEPFWGQGYMTETVEAVNEFIFETLKIDSFIVCNALGNEKSRRIKEKTGAIFLEIVDLPHHSGINQSEKWLVTRESWLKSKKSGV